LKDRRLHWLRRIVFAIALIIALVLTIWSAAALLFESPFPVLRTPAAIVKSLRRANQRSPFGERKHTAQHATTSLLSSIALRKSRPTSIAATSVHTTAHRIARSGH
jgi:ABC-type nitrate/sulfonate/bicarbonate transport system permease component